MKRIVFCFDGTWNELHATFPTNVVLVAESIFPAGKDGLAQVIHYDDGVGTGGDDWKWKQRFEQATGGILGWGLLDNIREAYRFLIFNYEPGDQIFVFGFSRGAYTARSFIGLVGCASIVARRDAAQINAAVELYRNRRSQDPGFSEDRWQFRAKYAPHIIVSDEEEAWRGAKVADFKAGSVPRLTIRYLGLWDTVGALGLPESLPWAKGFNARHQFHDPELPRFVESGRHAVALDERRRTFPLTSWDNAADRNRDKGVPPEDPRAPIQEQWFPGTHGSIGGGGDIRGLSDAALGWVIEGAKRQGLELDTSASSRVYELQPDHRAPLANMKSGLDFMSKWFPKRERQGPEFVHQVHVSTMRRWAEPAENLPEKGPLPARVAESSQRVDLDREAASAPPPFSGPVLARHVVVERDSLRKLAKRFYDDARQSTAIFDANRAVLDSPDELYVGDELIIPALEKGESKE